MNKKSELTTVATLGTVAYSMSQAKAGSFEGMNNLCDAKGPCKGMSLGSFEGMKNLCDAKGPCKGMRAGPFEDKNMAVEMANQHMAKKRMGMMENR